MAGLEKMSTLTMKNEEGVEITFEITDEQARAAIEAVNNNASKHNTDTASHNDIRLLIEGLTTRLNALANSDDTTLDQMAEVVSYIKNNKSLIDGITTSKVNVSDIINNLTTNASNKPLSAAQGVALKSLVDALQTAVNGKQPRGNYALQSDVTSLSKEVADLKVADYVKTEAQNVADKVLGSRNAHSFVFGAISDLHTIGTEAGILHAGQGMDVINSITQLDLVAIFGDIILDKFTDTYKEGFNYVRKCFYDVFKDTEKIYMQGNHDELSSDTTAQGQQKYFAYIGANNVGTVTDFDNRHRNYGYKDFESQRFRVIYLNSADVSAEEITYDCYITKEQFTWFVNTALNFSDKTNPETWHFIVMCHFPLNWYGTSMANLLTILDSYKGGTSGSITADGTAIAYNFTSSTRPKFVAHFHGHLHNFRTETLGSNGVLSITIPNACATRNNEYGTYSGYSDEVHEKYGDTDENGNQRQFNKTAGTAEDTAFNVIVVDTENEVIHAYCYGAGIDRVISFAGNVEEPDEPVIPDEPEEIINLIDTVGYTDNKRFSTSSAGTLKDETGYVVTGIIDLSKATLPVTLRTQGVNFNGNVYSNCTYTIYKTDGTAGASAYLKDDLLAFEGETLSFDADGNMTLVIPTLNVTYPMIAICGYGSGKDLVVTVNQEIPDEPIAPDEPEEIVNILDTIGYTDGKRCKTSSCTLGDLEGATAFGWYDCSNLTESDVIRIYLPNGIPTASSQEYVAHVTSADETTTSYLNYYYQGYLNPFGAIFDSYTYDNNVITLTGRNASRSATKFRMSAQANGADCIMTLNQEIPKPDTPTPSYTNRIPLSLASDGSEYVGHNGEDGYSAGYRVNSSGTEVQQSGMCCTGYILCDVIGGKPTIRLKNITVSGTKDAYIAFYYQDKSFWQVDALTNVLKDDGNGVYTGTLNHTGYIRIACGVIDDTTILTIDEEIK